MSSRISGTTLSDAPSVRTGVSAASATSSGRKPRITGPRRGADSAAPERELVARRTARRAVAVARELGLDEVHRWRADELGDEQIRRPLVEPLRRVDLLEHAAAHHRHAVAHRHRLGLVVRDVDRRHREIALDPQDLGAHLDAQLRVEVRERLVHQERLRLADDRAAHRHALPLAARERARLLAERLLEPERARGLRDPALDLGLRELALAEPEGHVVEHVHVRVERVVLEHHRDVALLRQQVVDDAAADPDHAAR